MSTREARVALLKPLVDRMCVSHFWRASSKGPFHIREPFTASHLSEHAAGTGVYGLTFIKPGESTTRAACVDFDSHGGEIPFSEMERIADAVAGGLEQEGFRPSLFRSSGGNGIHLWLIFDTDQDAFSVRRMLIATLAAHGLEDGAGGVYKKQAEVNPKQVQVDADKFGNMVLLPWAKRSEPLGDFSGFEPSPSVPVVAPAVRQPRASTETSPELSRIKSALDAIPNSGENELEYKTWHRLACAVDHATGHSEEGLQLVQEFTSRASGTYDAEETEGIWNGMRSDRENPLTAQTLFDYAASKHNWMDPKMAEGFDVIEETPEELATRAIAKAKATDPWQIYQMAALRTRPRPPWIIRDVLPHAETGMIYGPSGSGKSFFTLDMAASIARGIPWRGKRVTRGRVLYVAAEGAAAVYDRGLAYAIKNEMKLEELDIYVMPATPNFTDKKVVAAVTKTALAKGPFLLIVIDTLAKVSIGADENSAQHMGVVMAHCQMLGKQTGSMVVVVHHTGKNAALGSRGSSSIKAGLDVEIEIVRADKDRSAIVKKLRDGEDGAEFGFQLNPVHVGVDEDGGPVTSCVLEYTDSIARTKKAMEPQGVNQKLAFEAVRDLAGIGGDLPSREDVLSRACPLMPSGTDEKRKQNMTRALNAVIQSGRVLETNHGLMLREGGRERATSTHLNSPQSPHLRCLQHLNSTHISKI